MKRSKPAPVPFAAVPVTLFGEAACAFADEMGIHVSTYALRGERPMSTADARDFLASGKLRGLNFASGIWLIVAYNMPEVA